MIQREIRGEENKKEIIGYNNIAHLQKFDLSLRAFDLALFDVAPFGAPYSLIICMPQQRKFWKIVFLFLTIRQSKKKL